MKASVRAYARPFTTDFEGEVREMYVDILGLVTCGIGNLLDDGTPGPALALPWVHRSDGSPALPEEISQEWRAVKFGKLAWYPRRPPRPIILTDEGLTALFFRKLDQNEAWLAKRWPTWDQWPADAQLGAHSCAWAAGPGWTAPRFDLAAVQNSADGWRTCAGRAGYDPNDPSNRGQAWLRDTKPEDDARGVHTPTLNPGLRPRNVANQTLFQNAAMVAAHGYDPERLYYPTLIEA